MHRRYLLLLLSSLFLGACSEEVEELIGNWAEASDFEGVPRNNAVSFVIGDFAYLGTGFDGDDYLNDFWRYDADNNFWTQQANFPGPARTDAVAFAANGKGFIGTGYDGEQDEDLKDFWAYNPNNDTWEQVADFGGSARRGAIAFSIDDRGYVGTGNDGNDLKDFWEYNPLNDTWRQVVSLGGSKRLGAFAFVINNRAFVGGGRNNGVFEEDFWEFDPSAGDLGQWIRKEDLATDDYNITREGAVAFGLSDKGYLITGSRGAAMNDVWAYNVFEDVWEEKTALDGVSRTDAVGFVVKGIGYITTGRNSLERYDDLWAFFPDQADNEDD